MAELGAGEKKRLIGAIKFMEKYENSPKCIIFHVAENTLSDTSPEIAVIQMTDLINLTREKFPQSKLLISEVFYRNYTNRWLENSYCDSADRFNNLIRDIYDNDLIISHHESFRQSRFGIYKSDGVHLNNHGVRLFVMNM